MSTSRSSSSTFTVGLSLVTMHVPPNTITGAEIKNWFLQSLRNRGPADFYLLACSRDDRVFVGNIPVAISDNQTLQELDISPANAQLTLKLNDEILGPFPMAAGGNPRPAPPPLTDVPVRQAQIPIRENPPVPRFYPGGPPPTLTLGGARPLVPGAATSGLTNVPVRQAQIPISMPGIFRQSTQPLAGVSDPGTSQPAPLPEVNLLAGGPPPPAGLTGSGNLCRSAVTVYVKTLLELLNQVQTDEPHQLIPAVLSASYTAQLQMVESLCAMMRAPLSAAQPSAPVIPQVSDIAENLLGSPDLLPQTEVEANLAEITGLVSNEQTHQPPPQDDPSGKRQRTE